jgi:thiol-disulfide isomerase/thioredoxin
MQQPMEQPMSPPSPQAGRESKIALAVLLVAALVVVFWPRGSGRFKEPGGFLYDSGGRATTIGPRLAPVTLVHFWATWCPPCLEEIPALSRLTRDFSPQEDFGIVMVAVADSTEKVRSFMGSQADMMLFDPDWTVANRYGTDKLPETYLVVRGEVIEKLVGQQNWDDPALRSKLSALLAGR